MKKLTILIALTLLTACNPKKSSVNAATTATIAGVPIGTMCTGVGTNQYGTIYDNSMSLNFETQVKGLLSATIAPSDVGSISSRESDATGVRFSGQVKLDANGAVVPAQSRVRISVYDSVWLNNRYTNANEVEIQIDFDPTKGSTITGQFSTATGEGTLSLKDKYGEIRFVGKIDAQRLSGTVTFQNTTNVSGGAGASGTLGQFYIQRCAFLM